MRENAYRKELPMYRDWIRGTDCKLWCDVITMTPRLRIPWKYNEDQEMEGDVWECGAVWIHCATCENGEIYQASLHEELREAVNILNANIERAQYTLLVNPDGMYYDANRLGGDHDVKISTGRHFVFSVRVDDRRRKHLLAIAF